MEDEVVASKRVGQATKLSKIVDKALDSIDDRLDNGDFILNNKTGKVVRKPVGLRDAVNAASALMQRAEVIENMNKQERTIEATQSIEDQLKLLANEFARFNNKGKFGAEDISFTETPAPAPITDEGELPSHI